MVAQFQLAILLVKPLPISSYKHNLSLWYDIQKPYAYCDIALHKSNQLYNSLLDNTSSLHHHLTPFFHYHNH
jgi:predicted transglutaminase-like protease